MNNPIRDILYDMDLEFTSTIPMSDEQADEVYERYAKIVKNAVVDEFVELTEQKEYLKYDEMGFIKRVAKEYKGE